jgi:hypothetical protein
MNGGGWGRERTFQIHPPFVMNQRQSNGIEERGNAMRQHYEKIIRDTEQRVQTFLQYQVREEGSFFDGGFMNSDRYVDPKATIFYLANLAALYFNPQSRFFRDPSAIGRVRAALDYELRVQRPDGTFDFLDCNFYAAPDTAFYINRLVSMYRVVVKYGNLPEDAWLTEKLYAIIERAGYGMAAGGFHTPNHRWAIAAALSSCYNLTGVAAFREAAAKYLNEGIDCNADGEYAERSAGNYNGVNNEQLIILALETGDDSYLEHVRRNLELSLFYIDPDGSVFTNNSTRQDYGTKKYPESYYYQYLYLAWKCGIPHFAAAAGKIMADLAERGDPAPDCLDWYMLYPELIEYPLPEAALPTEYEAFYPASGIVRVRRGNHSFSLIRGNSRFLYFQVGALSLYLKIGVSYFDQREFRAESIERTTEGYRLTYQARGWYYLPFDEKPATADWWSMDHRLRKKLSGPDLAITVTVKEIAGGIAVRIATSGCDRVPLKIETAFPADAFIQTESFMCTASAGEALTVKRGQLEVTKGLDTILLGPAFANHNFVGGKFGSEARSANHFTVYFTDFSHFDHTLTIREPKND